VGRVKGRHGVMQTEVLKLRRQGLSHRQIGVWLGISHQAVTYHLRVFAPCCQACGVRLSLVTIRRIQRAAAGR